MIDKFIKWACLRSKDKNSTMRIINSQKQMIFHRFCFLLPDEFWHENEFYNRLPWWLPFNMFIHKWEKNVSDPLLHSHPRWSITIVLKGKIRELTPKHDTELKPGAIVIRTHKFIHKFFTTDDDQKCVTLFIVGRRKYTQYDYDNTGKIIQMVGHEESDHE